MTPSAEPTALPRTPKELASNELEKGVYAVLV